MDERDKALLKSCTDEIEQLMEEDASVQAKADDSTAINKKPGISNTHNERDKALLKSCTDEIEQEMEEYNNSQVKADDSKAINEKPTIIDTVKDTGFVNSQQDINIPVTKQDFISCNRPTSIPDNNSRFAYNNQGVMVSLQDRIISETIQNKIFTGYYNSIKGVRKVLEEQELEYRLNQLRWDMSSKGITPLQEKLSVATPFPLKILPDWAVSLVSELAHSLRVKIEAVAPALLGATFIGARGNYVIKVKNDYQEPLTEYIIVTIPSGGRKSAIVDFFRKPINALEAELQIDFDKNPTSGKSYREALAAVKGQVKSKKIPKHYLESSKGIIKGAQELSEKLEIIDRENQKLKARPKLLIDSPTSKRLSLEMKQQDESIGIFEAEGSILKHRIRPSENNIYLKGYTMEPFGDETIANSVNMQGPCLAICIYEQDSITEKLYTNDALKFDGFLPRFLPVFVSKDHGDIDHNPSDVSEELIERYSDKIRSLLRIQRPIGHKGDRTCHVLELNDEAQESWRDYKNLIAGKIRAGFFQDFEAFGEKLAGHAVRLAGALHLLKYDIPHDHEIDAETMAGGIALAEYFAEHAVVAFDKNYLQGILYAKKILQWIDNHREPIFPQRKAQRGIHGSKKVEIKPGMDVLEKNGFIIRFYTTQTTYWIVNPKYSFNLVDYLT